LIATLKKSTYKEDTLHYMNSAELEINAFKIIQTKNINPNNSLPPKKSLKELEKEENYNNIN